MSKQGPQSRRTPSRRAQRAAKQQRQHRQRLAAALSAAVVIVVVIVGILLISSDEAGGDATTANLSLIDYGIEGDLEVPAGHIRLSATNDGEIPHNIGVRGVAISNEVRPGGLIDLDLGELAPGTYELYCDIADHVNRGMVAEFTVVDDTVSEAVPAT